MVKITTEMRNNSKEQINNICKKIDKSIQYSVDRGYCKACFDCDKDDPHYQTIRKMYEDEGYTIKPTGYIGGVWQLTEDICW